MKFYLTKIFDEDYFIKSIICLKQLFSKLFQYTQIRIFFNALSKLVFILIFENKSIFKLSPNIFDEIHIQTFNIIPEKIILKQKKK